MIGEYCKNIRWDKVEGKWGYDKSCGVIKIYKQKEAPDQRAPPKEKKQCLGETDVLYSHPRRPTHLESP